MDIKPSLQLTALAAGQLDAMVASEPTPTQAEANGIGRQLSTLGGLDNVYPIFILVNRGFARENPGTVLKFLKAIKQAAAYVQYQPDAAMFLRCFLTRIWEKGLLRLRVSMTPGPMNYPVV